MDREIKTDIFSISTASHARTALSLLAGKWWWVIVIPWLIALALGTVNIAFIFAAMIWIFMLLPPAVMIAYYNYLLQPVAAKLSRPHYIVFRDNGNLSIIFPPQEDNENKNIKGTDLINRKRNEAIEINRETIIDISESGSNILIMLRHKGISFILIPTKSIPREGFEFLESL